MNSKCDETLDVPALCRVPNGADNNPRPLHLVQNDVRSASDDQLPNPRLSPDPPQVRMIS